MEKTDMGKLATDELAATQDRIAGYIADEIERLLAQGFVHAEIADALKVHPRSISRWRRELHYPKRPRTMLTALRNIR